MRPPHRILDRHQVHRRAAEHLQAHLKFKAYSLLILINTIPIDSDLVLNLLRSLCIGSRLGGEGRPL
jgi:hypothetical protein